MLEGRLKGTFDENYSLYQYLPPELRQKFYDLLLYCYEYTERLWYLNRCPELTDYGRNHAERVMEMLTKILEPKFKDNFQFLNSYELYFLLCATMLHDIGISIPGVRDCDKIRENHGIFSALRIASEHDIPLGDKDERDIIGGICKYHQLRTPLSEYTVRWLHEHGLELLKANGEDMQIIDDVHNFSSPNGNIKIRTRFLAALLQLANACDVEFDPRMAQFYEFRTTENLAMVRENQQKIEKLRGTIESVRAKIQLIDDLDEKCKAVSKCPSRRGASSKGKVGKSEKVKCKVSCESCIYNMIDLSFDRNLISELTSEMMKLEWKNRFLLRQAHRYKMHQSINEVYIEGNKIVLEPMLNLKSGWKDELRETRRDIRTHIELVKDVLAENGIMLNDVAVEGLEAEPHIAKRVKMVYLIYKDGRLIRNYPESKADEYDSDIFSGMLTALHDFAKEILQSTRSIGLIEYGENKILIEKGQAIYAAAVIHGKEPETLRARLNALVREFESKYENELCEWSGDAGEFGYADEMLKEIVK